MNNGTLSVLIEWPKGHVKLTDIIMPIRDLKKMAASLIDYEPEKHKPIAPYLKYKRNQVSQA